MVIWVFLYCKKKSILWIFLQFNPWIKSVCFWVSVCIVVCVPCSTLAMRCISGSQTRHSGGSATMSRNMLSITRFYKTNTKNCWDILPPSILSVFLFSYLWVTKPRWVCTCCGKQQRATVCVYPKDGPSCRAVGSLRASLRKMSNLDRTMTPLESETWENTSTDRNMMNIIMNITDVCMEED